ncbi:hypothetical protein [Sulfolobus tengchongensis spindle-shaped virus 3]|nr:hypothetical protein [Sulfolobus tengchongensis spindle-shaped virus 3]
MLNVQPIGTYTGQLHTVFSALDDPQMREVLKFTLLSGIISELGSFYLVPKEATVTSVKSSFLNDINHLVIKITYTLDNKEEEVCVELEQRNMILTNVDTLQSILNAYVVPCEIAPKTQQKYSLLKRD